MKKATNCSPHRITKQIKNTLEKYSKAKNEQERQLRRAEVEGKLKALTKLIGRENRRFFVKVQYIVNLVFEGRMNIQKAKSEFSILEKEAENL